MEQFGAAPVVEKLKRVPIEYDLNAYTNILDAEIVQSRKHMADLKMSAKQVMQSLTREDRIRLATYPTDEATSFAKGKVQPLTHDAIEEERERMKRMEEYAGELQDVITDVANERIPGHEAIQALKEALHLDQSALYEAQENLAVLQRKHDAGEQLSPIDYRKLRKFSESVAERRGRIRRMKGLLLMFREVLAAQEEEFGGGMRGSERAKVERSSQRLMADWKNRIESDEYEEEPFSKVLPPLTSEEEIAA